MKPALKFLREDANRFRKLLRKEVRRQELVALGRTLVTKEITTEVDGKPVVETISIFPPEGRKGTRGKVKQPREFRVSYFNSTALAFLSGKTFKHSGAHSKTRPGNKELHIAAQVENGLGFLARQEELTRRKP
jgi:hypothetical protein